MTTDGCSFVGLVRYTTPNAPRPSSARKSSEVCTHSPTFTRLRRPSGSCLYSYGRVIVQLPGARRIGGVSGRARVELLDLLDVDIRKATVHLVDRGLPPSSGHEVFMVRLLEVLQKSPAVFNEVPYAALSSCTVTYRVVHRFRLARHPCDGDIGVIQRRVSSFMRLRRTNKNAKVY